MKKLSILFLILIFGISASISVFAQNPDSSCSSARVETRVTDNFETNHHPYLLNYLSVKFDGNTSQNLVDEDGRAIVDVTITDGKLLEFTAKPGVFVHDVYVKGGTGGGGTLYTYSPHCTSGDSELIANKNQNEQIQEISHYTFYYTVQPEQECKDETAWALGTDRIMTKGNWATYFEYDVKSGKETTYKLMAGQHKHIGSVTVKVVGDNLVVTYDTTSTLYYTHLYVGTSAPKSAAPGQFPNKGATTTYEIPLSNFDGATKLYIAAHADASVCD